MSKTPRITGKEAIKAFRRVGFRLDRIRGSHHILKRDADAGKVKDPRSRQQLIDDLVARLRSTKILT